MNQDSKLDSMLSTTEIKPIELNEDELESTGGLPCLWSCWWTCWWTGDEQQF
ncbi:hypothetical protein KSF73_06665 [Burkholderiaceae bacterium DAT-1]|nr:hypothetical protein [Burkholderiaceae bacterium DAT-1]